MAQAKTLTKAQRPRPLSPHLQIYRPLVNMMMSIIHRITGCALYFGTLLLAWWLIAAAAGPDQFAIAQAFLRSPLGLLILLGYTWAFMHHLLGGIRHLIWDTGRGFALPTVDALCWLTVALSLALTVAIWAAAWHFEGAL